ncbi:MAG: VanW family protein, partial [Eggerthellaceae bacterium]|nr:VanW family protein [Eggerthellaceae bacterium]
VDEIGGGICQVATTVFNAVYNAGYPVLERHNHSLFIASYPPGQDAAVNWPDLNLRWENDSDSDVLLAMSYTDSTVTATIYGVNPGYQVGTDISDWYNVVRYKTQTVTDDTLAEGASSIKTHGADGATISVVRTVKDKYGALLFQDNFVSVYDSQDEVKQVGPNTPEDKTEDDPNRPITLPTITPPS